MIDRIAEGSRGVEVGVWKGDFSARALRRSRPASIGLVDPWVAEEDPGNTGWYGQASQAEMDAICEGVLQRFRSEIASGRVEVHRMASLDAVLLFDDGSLDWAYIDGDHRFDGCLADLEAWLPKLRVGGMLCGDDYGSRGWWSDGVTDAVMSFVRDQPVRIDAIFQTQFVLTRLA